MLLSSESMKESHKKVETSGKSFNAASIWIPILVSKRGKLILREKLQFLAEASEQGTRGAETDFLCSLHGT